MLTEIALLNDKHRRTGDKTLSHGVAILMEEKPAQFEQLMSAIVNFPQERFTPNKDPWEEHDFGSVEVAGKSSSGRLITCPRIRWIPAVTDD